MARVDISLALKTAPPSADFVLPGLVAGSVGALFSPGGTGKTFFLTEASIAVACPIEGGDILHLQPQKHGRVVYFAAEDPALEIRRRIHSIGQHLTTAAQDAIADSLEMESVIGSRMNVVAERQLAKIISQTAGARLIVFDTLSRIHTRVLPR